MEKPLWMICVTHMFLETFFLVQVALIPVFIQEFHLNLFEASFIATFPSLVQLLMNFPFGFLADRFNTKHLLFASMFVEGFSAFIVSQMNNFWVLVLGVSLMRISSPLYHISGLSQISRLAKTEEISRSMGFHNALGSLGSAAGLVSLAFFLSTIGWRWIYIFWAVPILIWGFIILRSSQYEAKISEISEQDMLFKRLSQLFSPGFLIFLVATSLRGVAYVGTSTFMTTYLVEIRGLSEATASLIFGLGPFIGIIGSLNGGYLSEKMGAKNTLSLTILGGVISLLFLALSTHLYVLTIIYLVYTFFSNSVWSPINIIVAAITPRTHRGFSFSVYFFTERLMASITPTIAAAVIGTTNTWYIFPFSIIFMSASLTMIQLPIHSKKPV